MANVLENYFWRDLNRCPTISTDYLKSFFSLLPCLYFMIFFKLEGGSPGEQDGFVIVVVVVGFLSPVEETLLRHMKGSTW